MDSAIKSVRLPAAAYLVKPIDLEELESSVRTTVARSRVYRAVRDTKDHLREWQEKLNGMQEVLSHEAGKTDPVPVDIFINVTLHNMILSLASFKNVTEAVARLTGEHDVCHLLGCPRLDNLSGALRDTIEVLEKTKSAFKSKELGELRRRLEGLLGPGNEN